MTLLPAIPAAPRAERIPGTATTVDDSRIVLVEAREQYGMTVFYPKNRNAERFAALTGKKTILSRDAALIRELGFEIFTESTFRNL